MSNKRDVACWSLICKNCGTFIRLGKNWKAEVIIQPIIYSLLIFFSAIESNTLLDIHSSRALRLDKIKHRTKYFEKGCAEPWHDFLSELRFVSIKIND